MLTYFCLLIMISVYPREKEAVAMQTITRVTATNGISWQSRIV